jgi:hypothetical protein
MAGLALPADINFGERSQLRVCEVEPVAQAGIKLGAESSPDVVLWIWLLIALAGVWVCLDARRHRVTVTDGPYGFRNGALVVGSSGIVAFFGVQFLLGVWMGSVAWLAVFGFYLFRRSVVLAGRTDWMQSDISTEKLPPLPVIPRDRPPVALDPASSPAAEDAVVKPKTEFVKGLCEKCGGHMEFNPLAAGQTVDCPHCKQPTKLVPSRPLTDAPSRQKAKSLPVGILVGRQPVPTPSPTPPMPGSKPN